MEEERFKEILVGSYCSRSFDSDRFHFLSWFNSSWRNADQSRYSRYSCMAFEEVALSEQCRLQANTGPVCYRDKWTDVLPRFYNWT